MIDPEELAFYEAEGWVKSQRHEAAPYTIWNYTQKTQYEGNWDHVTRNARGLILADNGEVIARPFPKIFNYGEPSCVFPLGEKHWVTEKLDGSLGIAFTLPDGEVEIATRGSFKSEQALRARQMLEDHLERDGFAWPVGVTPLFEIIYPANRIVVNYGERAELVLLAGIEIASGLDRTREIVWDGARADHLGNPAPVELKYMAQRDKSNREGVVVAFEGGTRVKIKTDEYVRLHRIVTGLNSKTVWEMLRDGAEDFDDLLDGVPDEFFEWVTDTAGGFIESYANIEVNAKLSRQDHPHRDNYPEGPEGRREYNKAFAESVQGEDPVIRAVLFAMRDDKPYAQIIWKAIKPDQAEVLREVVE